MAARISPEADGQGNWKDIKAKITDVLVAFGKPIKANSFWNQYMKHHGLKSHELPQPKLLGLQKRIDILRQCNICELTVDEDQWDVVQLIHQPDEGKNKKGKGKTLPANGKRKDKSQRQSALDNDLFAQDLKKSLFQPKEQAPSKASTVQDKTPDSKMSGGHPPWLMGGHFAQGHNPQWSRPHYHGGQRPGHPYYQHGHQSAPIKPVKHIPMDQIDTVAKDCIARLVEACEYVSVERIEKLVRDYFKVESMAELNIRHMENISCVNQHIRTQVKVNGYIQGFVRIRAVATLYELHENLREYTTARQDFVSLQLGPLAKQPMVYDFFKFPHDGEILNIETRDVLDHLRQYLSEENLWMTKIELDGFMGYLARVYNVDTPFALGIRIKSMPLVVGLLKKSQRDANTASKACVEACNTAAEQQVKAAYRNFMASVVDDEEDTACKIREELRKATALRCVEQVFSKFNVLLRSIAYASSFQIQIKGLDKKVTIIEQFGNLIKKDKFLQRIFQATICCSWEEVHNSLQCLVKECVGIAPETHSSADGGEGASSSNATVEERQRPPLANVVERIKNYLERCFVHGSLQLPHLARIENKLLEEFGDFDYFGLMVNSTFLDFLSTNETIKQYLDENGGVALGMQQGSGARSGSGYHASLCDLQDFTLQSNLIENSMMTNLERALCWHYQVAEAKNLGHGSVASLQSGTVKAQRQSKQQSILFESALAANESQNLFGIGGRKVGLLGSQTKEAALLSLFNCPLLEDMAEWSHWDVIFKPELGDLKDFIRKNGGIQTLKLPNHPGQTMMMKLVALETKPGKLLKVTDETSNDAFAAAAASADVLSTCGHLASLITANKGVSKTPLALLGNHFKTGLLKIQGTSVGGTHADGSGDGDPSVSALGEFVVKCLTRLPFVICQSVADQVFLEPLTSVVGQTLSRELLARCVSSVEEENRLQLLGLVLGIDYWSRSFATRTQPPSQLQHNSPLKKLSEETAYIVLDSDEDDSASESGESDFLNSSDDEMQDVSEIKKEKAPLAENRREGEDEMNVETCEISGDGSSVIVLNDTADSQDGSIIEIEAIQEEVAELAEESDDPHLAVIEDIRRTEFGINVTLSAEGCKLMEKQQERQGRSLDRLSDELYSKDTHFVLELIQNADDNSYAADVVPAIKFVVEKDKITVLNNECGFNEENIRAICDVGKSTKGKHKAGYIGQKGIGFKSVFRVTDRPIIHSAGYHFKFDKSTGPIGYILPHWIAEKYDHSSRWATSILLPLKDDIQQTAKLRQLAARFQDVHPSLLLFLHRLRSITILNKIGDYKGKMERTDIGNNVIEVRHMISSEGQTSRTDRWIVVKKTLDASGLSIQAKSGVEVESTEIALAFPLHEVEDLQAQALPPKQPVFAFLPLRTYGFRFVVQGDFDVPSSREDICHDSLWNQWLQSEIHTLFADALNVFKNQRNLSTVEAVCLFIKFIPLEDEVLDFFRPVASQILQRLRSQPCLPTNAAPGAAPEWRLPSQLVLVTDPLLQEVATPDLLQSQLGLSYLHTEVGAKINASLLTSLGVLSLSTSHLIEIGRALANQLSVASIREKPGLMKRVGKWFAALYRSMDEINVDKKGLEQVKDLALVPLTNGEIISLKTESIFFPLGAEERREAGERNDLLLYLEKDLNTVSAELLNHLDDIARPQVWKTLEMLGVRKLVPADIINHHIIPALKQVDMVSKSQELLISYVIFIKEELDRQPNLVPINVLRDLLVIRTTQGFKKPATDNVHFPPKYLNKLHLQRDLPGYKWVLIDLVYLERCTTNTEILSWRLFFEKLGVTDILAVKEEKVSVTHQDVAESAWKQYAPLLPQAEQQFELIDYECDEFVHLVSSNSHSSTFHKQMQVLFDIIDAFWESDFKKYATTQIKSSTGIVYVEVETTFGMMLKQLVWGPYVMKLENTSYFSQSKRGQAAYSSLFTPSFVIERLVGNHVPYLDTLQQPRSQLVQFLQVKQTLTKELMLELLVTWGSRKSINSPQSFTTSLAHMKAVYTFLHEQLPPKDLQDLFHNHPVIFVPSVGTEFQHDPQRKVDGVMMNRNEVRWADPTNLFSKYQSALEDMNFTDCIRPSICVWYSDMETLMLHSARVIRFPSYSEKAELIIAIANSNPVGMVVSDVLQLFMQLGTDIEEHLENGKALPLELTQLFKKLKSYAVLPTKDRLWKKLGDKPLIADDRHMERLFAKKDGISFLTTDVSNADRRMAHRHRRGVQHEPEAVISFYQAFGVEQLSNVITSEYVTESFKPCPSLHAYIASVMVFIQACVYNEAGDIYQALVNDGIAAKVKRMQFIQVGRLEVVYRLKPFPDVVVALGETCKLKDSEDEFTFYIHKDSNDNTFEMNKELARYFSRTKESCAKEIRHILSELRPLVRNQSEELRDFMENQGIEELPEDEERWEPPIFVRPRIPTPPPLPPPRPPSQASQADERPGTPSSQYSSGGPTQWPPRSDPAAANRPGGPRGPYQPSVWPPPAPVHPPSRPDVSCLPTHLRPARADLLGANPDGQGPSSTHEGGTGSSGGHSSHSGGHSSGPSGYSGGHPGGYSGGHPGGYTGGHPDGHHGGYPGGHPGGHPMYPTHGGQGQRPADPTEQPPPPGVEVSEADSLGSFPAGEVPRPPGVDMPSGPGVEGSEVNMEHSHTGGLSSHTDQQTSQDAGVQGSNDFKKPFDRPPHPPALKRMRYESGMSTGSAFDQEQLWFDVPQWSHLNVDETLTEARKHVEEALEESRWADHLPSDLNLDDKDGDGDTLVGRWGEELVYNYLLTLKDNQGSNVMGVTWINENSETMSPYDLDLQIYNPETETIDHVYVEVKATRSDKKAFFPISSQELEFAFDKKDSFHLYRVYNAGKQGQTRLTRIENLAAKMENKLVRLCLVI